MIVDEVVVRNYNGTHEVSCGYSRPVGNYINQIDNPVDRDVFIIRDLSTGAITNIDTLPAGYHVRDIRFVSLYNNIEQRYEDLCVFCGDRMTIIGGHWGFAPPGEPAPWIIEIDYSGFVGFFYMDAALNPSSYDTIYLRDIERTKSLSRMVAYNEYNGEFNSYCGNVYTSHPVLDIVGVPADSTGHPSCLARVKFYPSCNDTILWDNYINYPYYNDETIVDIAGTDHYIVTVSKKANDDKVIWVRYNQKETTYYNNGLPLTDTVFQFNLQTLICNESLPNDLSLTHYIGNPRVSSLNGNYCVLSFFAVNNENDIYFYKGVFNIKIRFPFRITTEGNYDKYSCSIIDVSNFPNENSSVTLSKEDNNDYVIHTVRWNTTPFNLYPVYILNTGTNFKHSIDTYRNPSNTSYLHIGGSYQESNFRKWLLADHVFFTNLLNYDCFNQRIQYIPTAGIDFQIFTEKGFVRKRFERNKLNYQMKKIPMRNITESVINQCIK